MKTVSTQESAPSGSPAPLNGKKNKAKLASALRANLRRRKQATQSVKKVADEGTRS